MKTFLTSLAVLTVVATPAFAKSFDRDNGTGNVLSFSSEPTITQNDRFAVRQNGLDAQAPGPAGSAGSARPPGSQSQQSRDYGVVESSARLR
jgi:hypothetical protein